MRKRSRIILWLCGAGLLLAAVLIGLYLSTQHVPAFYRRAMAVETADQEKQSDQMLQQTTALVSGFKKQGHWEVVFTAQQINGWLAVDMVRNHPGALPSSLGDPRVAVESNRLMLACRYQWGFFSTVLSLTVDPYLAEPNVLALRIRKARAGVLPIPAGRVLDRISEAARGADLRLTWRHIGSDPVAMISLPASSERDGNTVRIESLQLATGEIYIAGTTERR